MRSISLKGKTRFDTPTTRVQFSEHHSFQVFFFFHLKLFCERSYFEGFLFTFASFHKTSLKHKLDKKKKGSPKFISTVATRSLRTESADSSWGLPSPTLVTSLDVRMTSTALQLPPSASINSARHAILRSALICWQGDKTGCCSPTCPLKTSIASMNKFFTLGKENKRYVK